MTKFQKYTIKTLLYILSLSVLLSIILAVYLAGFVNGKMSGLSQNLEDLVNKQIEISSTVEEEKEESGEAEVVISTPKATIKPASVAWGGPQLWEEVNKRRVQLGVNGMSQKDEVCTIASIRLNQILDKGDLDGHEGFSKLPEQRLDLKWIFDKYNLSEFLVSGATSPKNAVELWENSLGHRKLLSGGEYVWGCIYAQNGYGVAIAAY